jgi:hypothetical protein
MELARSSLALDQMCGTWIQSEGVAGEFSQAGSLELMMFDDAPRDDLARDVDRLRVPLASS